jgi:hypothetical protein
METRTKHMARSEPPANEQLFPAPPTNSADITLKMYHTVRMDGDYTSYTSSKRYTISGSFGDPTGTQAVKRIISPPEWIPEEGHKKGHGVWRRVVRFESAVSISEVPNFSTEIDGRSVALGVSYLSHMRTVDTEIPLVLARVLRNFPWRWKRLQIRGSNQDSLCRSGEVARGGRCQCDDHRGLVHGRGGLGRRCEYRLRS